MKRLTKIPKFENQATNKPLAPAENDFGESPVAGVPAEVPGPFSSSLPLRHPLCKRPKPSTLQKAKTIKSFPKPRVTSVYNDPKRNIQARKNSVNGLKTRKLSDMENHGPGRIKQNMSNQSLQREVDSLKSQLKKKHESLLKKNQMMHKLKNQNDALRRDKKKMQELVAYEVKQAQKQIVTRPNGGGASKKRKISGDYMKSRRTTRSLEDLQSEVESLQEELREEREKNVTKENRICLLLRQDNERSALEIEVKRLRQENAELRKQLNLEPAPLRKRKPNPNFFNSQSQRKRVKPNPPKNRTAATWESPKRKRVDNPKVSECSLSSESSYRPFQWLSKDADENSSEEEMTLKPLSTKPRKQTSAGGNKLPESPPVNLEPPICVKREKSGEIAFPNLMVGDAWAKLQCKPYDEAEKKTLLSRYNRIIHKNCPRTRRLRTNEVMPTDIGQRILDFEKEGKDAEVLVLLRWWDFRDKNLKKYGENIFTEKFGAIPFKLSSDEPFPMKDGVKAMPERIDLRQETHTVDLTTTEEFLLGAETKLVIKNEKLDVVDLT